MADVATLPELPLARWPSADGKFPEGPGAEVPNLTQLFPAVIADDRQPARTGQV